jgi:hypothetical protein
VGLLGLVMVVIVGCGPVDSAAPPTTPSTPQPSPYIRSEEELHADNDGWRQRQELTGAQEAVGEERAAEILEALTEVQAAGDFEADPVLEALLALGYSRDVVLVGIPPPPWWDTELEVQIVVYGVEVDTGVCVYGDVRPERVQALVGGPVPEYGCIEP